MFTYKKENSKVPIKVWMSEEDYYADEKMVEQVENISKLPFAFSHVALSPDGHVGYGAPIGGIMAAKGVVIPNFVGMDIGCGMCAVKTSLTSLDKEDLKKIMGEIRKAIPVGFNKHKEEQDRTLMPEDDNGYDYENFGYLYSYDVVSDEWTKALKSLGTLGGGNHFIEIQKGDDGHIWIMIHSGSRNLGLQVANHYNKIAKELNEKWYTGVPKEWDLAFLPINSEEGQAYLREMNYCIEYALANRKLMMNRVCEIFKENTRTERSGIISTASYPTKFDPIINIAHNYAKMENHFGSNVMVHRKGATLASSDTVGIIPGSQGTKSYIVRGKGNPDSFNSCSHGAGRRMGRKQAERELNLEEEVKALDAQGILHTVRGSKDLDEAPGAYKDIQTVMANQTDLVEVLVTLSPLAVIKG